MNPGNLTPDKRFSLLVWDVGRLLRKAVDARAAEGGMTSAQWHLMSSLARCEKLNAAPPTQAELAELLEIEPITLSRQIDRLTAAGLIERHRHPNDRRAYLLRLTDKAWPMVAAFKEIATEVLQKAIDGVSGTEIESMIASLERIRSNLTGKVEVGVREAAPAGIQTKESISA
jgi:MarR family transcriptional regulator for hemolysin